VEIMESVGETDDDVVDDKRPDRECVWMEVSEQMKKFIRQERMWCRSWE